ncbi:hypothetical protein CDAR_554571 [Caerostris darwini]|uniref:Uncharacterized protein n=1 Tax=Caerostris darwini TaxID=1538125 RepID=A0AAV4UK54_9ARAC|nr:hypothetical protein CDAR_554571 [Caerostris darwini]
MHTNGGVTDQIRLEPLIRSGRAVSKRPSGYLLQQNQLVKEGGANLSSRVAPNSVLYHQNRKGRVVIRETVSETPSLSAVDPNELPT